MRVSSSRFEYATLWVASTRFYSRGRDLAGGGPAGAQLIGETKWETVSLKIKNAGLASNKIMKGLVGGPLLVGGLGPGPLEPGSL